MYSHFTRRYLGYALAGLLALQNVALAQSALTVPVIGSPQSQQLCTGESCPALPVAALPSAPRVVPSGAPSSNVPLVQPVPPPTAEAPAPPSEFQEFVTSSVGRSLSVYGSSLFDHVPTTFAPVDRVPVTADYVVGPGDELLIRAWGQIDLDAKTVVDRGGDVYLPKVGTLTVAGLKYQQLQDYFRTSIGRVFRNFDVTVSLGQLRSIQVFVVGQARRPGSYTVSSLSTLVNTLFASGGPTTTGSMRHIQLKRNSRVVTEFDFYDLLLKGDKSKDVRLLPGDVIYVPPVGASIAIAGSVNVPAIYELRDRTELRDAIEMAGGLATTADGQKVVVERIENHSTRHVEEFPLDDTGLARQLKDGDLVHVFSLSPRFDNAVTLRGNVARPGRYEWHEGMRVKDVIPNRDALVTREYWSRSNSAAVAVPYRHSDGRSPAVTDATNYELRNEINRNAPDINWDYAVVQRLDRQQLTTRLLPFNLGKVVLEGDDTNNLTLEPGDMITIFSQRDLATPQARQTKFIRLEGEIASAGVYRVEPGETLRQLVQRAGGLTPNAYLYGAEFTRESVLHEQQKGMERLAESMEQEIARNATVTNVAAKPEDLAENRARLEAQQQLTDKLRKVKVTGRIVLELRPDATGANALPEIVLEDGDRLFVPYRPPVVGVLGAVYNRNSFLYNSERRVGDYLKLAGGATREADKARTFVIRADGSVLGRQNYGGLWNGGFDSLRILPGDTIVIPDRLQQGTTMRAVKDWTQIFSQFALGAAAVKVLQ